MGPCRWGTDSVCRCSAVDGTGVVLGSCWCAGASEARISLPLGTPGPEGGGGGGGLPAEGRAIRCPLRVLGSPRPGEAGGRAYGWRDHPGGAGVVLRACTRRRLSGADAGGGGSGGVWEGVPMGGGGPVGGGVWGGSCWGWADSNLGQDCLGCLGVWRLGTPPPLFMNGAWRTLHALAMWMSSCVPRIPLAADEFPSRAMN